MTLRRASDNVLNENDTNNTANKAEAESLSKPKVESAATDSNDSARMTRSRRSKRDVSTDNRVLEAYVGYRSKKDIPVSRLQNVDKIDYTTESNPSASNDGNIYNNYISKLEKIEGGDSNTQRYRLTLKDGDSIPSGGKIVFVGAGYGSPISNVLTIGTESIGSVRAVDNADSYGASNKLKDRLDAATKIDDYIRIVEDMDKYDIRLSTLVFEFNKNFEKYDKNRVVEFALNKSNRVSVDGGLITREYIDGFPDSNGVNHKLLSGNKMTSYLLNPYDPSKYMTAGETITYVDKSNLTAGRLQSNNMRAGTNYAPVKDKPLYFDYIQVVIAKEPYIHEGVSNSNEPVLKAGDTFTTTLTENSLFTTTNKYKV